MALVKIAVTTNGSGAGSTTSQPIRGTLMGLKVAFGGTPDAGTDTVISEAAGLGRTILTLTDNITNAQYNPMQAGNGPTGTALTFYSQYYLMFTPITVTVAGGVASTADAVVVTLNIKED